MRIDREAIYGDAKGWAAAEIRRKPGDKLPTEYRKALRDGLRKTAEEDGLVLLPPYLLLTGVSGAEGRWWKLCQRYVVTEEMKKLDGFVVRGGVLLPPVVRVVNTSAGWMACRNHGSRHIAAFGATPKEAIANFDDAWDRRYVK